MKKLSIHLETDKLLDTVISKLPEKIADYACNGIGFFENLKENNRLSYAICLDTKINKYRHFIIFDSKFRRLPRKKKLFVIAHEIAHAYLKHGEEKGKSKMKREKEANDFANKYGFFDSK
jgi:Zn-dependent peptidase ImmA (M78 family)